MGRVLSSLQLRCNAVTLLRATALAQIDQLSLSLRTGCRRCSTGYCWQAKAAAVGALPAPRVIAVFTGSTAPTACANARGVRRD